MVKILLTIMSDCKTKSYKGEHRTPNEETLDMDGCEYG